VSFTAVICCLAGLNGCADHNKGEFATKAGNDAANMGNYADAEIFLQFALQNAEKIDLKNLSADYFQKRQSKINESLISLANVYYCEQKYKEAEPLYNRALTRYDTNWRSVARHLTCLGALRLKQQKYTEAEPFLQRAVRIEKNKLLDTNDYDITPFWYLAEVYFAQGKCAEGEVPLHTVLDWNVYEQTFSNISPSPRYALSVMEGWLTKFNGASSAPQCMRERVARAMDDFAEGLRSKNQIAEADLFKNKASSIRAATGLGGAK
jgi:tetratricopeptide (TPR) repeat protein